MAQQFSGSAVLATAQRLLDVDPSELDPWKTLAEGGGLLVQWAEGSRSPSSQAVQTISAGSAFAQQLVGVVQRAGGSLSSAGNTLFRVELPAGRTIAELTPAIGGGLRGMTRAADTGRITSQARLIPVGGAAVGGAGALALGPLIGLMALSVATQMIAEKQQREKLDAIAKGVESLVKHELGEFQARLDSAEEKIADASEALRDQILIPQAVGLGSAVHSLSVAKHQVLAWMESWEKVAETFAGKTVDHKKLSKALDGVAVGGVEALPLHLRLTYRALALDSRAQVVALTESTLSGDVAADQFESRISEKLRENSAQITRLKKIVLGLSDIQLSYGRVPVPGPRELNAPAELQMRLFRLARALLIDPGGVPMMDNSARVVLELERGTNGDFQVFVPRAAAV